MISAVIIAKNEDQAIEDCLKSLRWVDEIVVIDGGSTDRTVELSKKYKARVIHYESKGFAERRNKGLEESSGDWILYIDADERITLELKKEILSTIDHQLLAVKCTAYAIPRRNFIFGKEFKHGGQWPDYVKRLFEKFNFKGWTGELHEEPNFDGKIGHLKNPMIHIKEKTLSEMVEKTNKWSEVEARLMFEVNHPPMNIARFFTAGFREFWLRMVRQLAFLDGGEGVIYALYQVYSRLISYTKLWEMQINIKD